MTAPASIPGTVYLLHFDRPLGDPTNPHGQARHYLGWAAQLEARLRHHRAGTGAAMTRAAVLAGIGFDVARTWENVDRHFERRLKNRKNARALCPLCKAEASLAAAAEQQLRGTS